MSPGTIALQSRQVGFFGDVFSTSDSAVAEGPDSLTISIWAPSSVPQEGCPVIVWFHGGGFVAGSAYSPICDGSSFARDGIVFAAMNYRLGAEGYLNVGCGDAPSNRGLLDQLAALEWVRDHIADFGGDPDRVTVAGHSAGAVSIALLLTSSAASGLFRAAILQSGALHHCQSIPTSEAIASHFRAALDTSLKELSPSALVERQDVCSAESILNLLPDIYRETSAKLPWLPVAGMAPIEQDPRLHTGELVNSGIPVLISVTRDESCYFTAGARDAFGPEMEEEVASFLFGDHAPEAIRRYRTWAKSPASFDVVGAMQSDHTFRRPAYWLADQLSPSNRVYVAEFRWSSPARGGNFGACHGLDLPFVFDTINLSGLANGAPPDLVEVMHDSWVAFSRSGDPSSSLLPDWPQYDPGDRSVQLLDTEFSVSQDPLSERRAFLEAHDRAL
jgi:carboxylesterase type B